MTEAIFTGSTDGPHSPAYTQQVASALARCVRVLNHATHPGNDGLQYPGDVYALLGDLYTATGGLPQVFEQLADFLQSQAEGGRLGDSDGRDPFNQALIAGLHLGDVASSAKRMTDYLQQAQNAISGLYVKDGDDA